MWRYAIGWTAICLMQACLIPSALGAWPESFRRDANLNDVCFVDRLTGWAVGDRGTILKTSDGGATWQSQTSPVDFRLESVHAIDAQQAWAVGGFTTAYTHRPNGVILQTDDGGITWKQSKNHFLPWLTHIQFLDARNGFAIGLPSAMFPSGVFRTNDGAKHWTPWPGNTPGCVAGHFDKDGPGLLVDQRGRLIRVEPQGLKALSQRPTAARQVRLISTHRAIICGIQGHVATSADGGRSWSRLKDHSTVGRLTEFDWRAIGGHGRHLWIAGVPGTRVLHTGDGGVSWELQETGQMLPLMAIDFVDDQHGWAVGSLGTILATRDGGQSWSRQDDSPNRLALMTVAADPASVSWELLAQASGGEGFLASVEVLSGPAPSIHDVSTVPIARRLHEATTSVAGACAHILQAVPMSDAALQLDATQWWQHSDAVGGNGQELLCEYLVRQIRMYRPEMLIVTDDASTSLAAAAATRGLVELAVQRASDPRQFAGQIEAGGLHTWTVRSIAGRTSEGIGPVYRVTSQRLALPLGQSVTQLADRAKSMMTARYVPGPDELRFEVAGRKTRGRSRGIPRLFDSSTLARGEPMHRTDLTLKDNFRQLHQNAQHRRTIEALLRSSDELATARLQQVTQLAQQLPPSDRGDLLYQTAYRLAEANHRTEAMELLEQLVVELPQHALAEAARLQLLRQSASLEGLLHWRVPNDDFSQPSTAGLRVRSSGGVQQATFETAIADQRPEDQQLTLSERRKQREERAIKIAQTIQAHQPDMYFEPMIRFPLASLYRRLGRIDEATAFWRTQATKQTDRTWRSRAAAELALTERGERDQLLAHVCGVIQERPYLDGKLEEATWNTEAMTLVGDRYSKHLATKLRWAWDDRFLFVAATCARNPEAERSQNSQPRQRDTDLSESDRLTLRLDIDRDYATSWTLTIDERGWANDSLNNDLSWNPKWFFDTSSDHLGWQVEVAIAWDQISPEPPRPGDAWAISIDRWIPGLGRQGWGQPEPRQVERHEVGLLFFK